MNPVDILRRYGVPVKRAVKAGRGWKLSAPHRQDKKPSFTIYRLSNDYPDDDPRAWVVRDWAEGFTMSMARYLREYFGVVIKGEKPSGGERKRERPPTLTEEVLARIASLKEGTPVEWEIPEDARPYTGHGFKRFKRFNSLDYGVYADTDGKPIIVFRDKEGGIVGVKKRVGRYNAKYVWLKGSSEAFWARRGTSKKLIVVEGEFKAIAMARLFPDYDVVGLTSKVSLPKAPVLGYQEVWFVLDPDVAFEIVNGKLESLEKLFLFLTLNGIRVKYTSFRHALGYKDVNDALEAGSSPKDVHLSLKKAARRVRFREDFLAHHMPVLKGINGAEAQLLYTLLFLALTRGRWVSASSVEVEARLPDLMLRTKMPRSTIYKAFTKLKDLGLLTYTNGHLGQDSGKPRIARLNLKALTSFLLSFSVSLPEGKHLRVSISELPDLFHSRKVWNGPTFTLPKVNRWYGAPVLYASVPIAHLVAADLIRRYLLTRYAVAKALRLGMGTLAELFTRIHLRFTRLGVAHGMMWAWREIEFYLDLRRIVVDRLRRFMPGTYLEGRQIKNKAWDFTLPYSALFSEGLV